jgi:hypothetical protein
MSQPETVEFALSGTANGVEIFPAHVPFGLMRKFHEEVERLVLGSNQGSLADTLVEIRKGSYALVVPIPDNVRDGFAQDMSVATDPDSSTHPDPTRLSVLQSWQKRAAFDRGIVYHIRPQSPQPRLRALKIDGATVLRRASDDRWVAVELLLVGEVREAGGEKTNIHVRLHDQPKSIIVAVTPDQLKAEAYPLFREKLLRVAAERNLRTKVLRRLRLIEFVPYKPEFDAAAFARMTAAGKKAWADVPDAAQWVREQRD